MSIDLRFQDFMAYVNGKIPGVNEQQRAVSIALGVAVARVVTPLPPGAAGEVHHYDTAVYQMVGQIVSAFNENYIVNTDLACETARAFWLMRQSVLDNNPDSVILPNGNGTFIEKVFGLNVQANPKTIEFCNRNSTVLATLVNRISFLLKPEQSV